MWWLENACVCYSSSMFQCVCGAADDMETLMSEEELKNLLAEASIVISSSEEGDGSAYLNPIIKIGWYKDGERFNVHRTPATLSREEWQHWKKELSESTKRNRIRFHIA